MEDASKFGDFLIIAFIIFALFPILRDGIGIVRPGLGEVETLIITAIPLTILLRWIYTLPLLGGTNKSNTRKR